MNSYIGTKLINAKPMGRKEYNEFRGLELPSDENGADAGYLVEYPGGGKNTEVYKGYISWSPAEQFEEAYRQTDGMNFGLAVEAMKKGFRVARSGWNGKGMFLQLVGDTDYYLASDTFGELPEGGIRRMPWIGMKTADNGFVPWLASQTDILSDDWAIVGE